MTSNGSLAKVIVLPMDYSTGGPPSARALAWGGGLLLSDPRGTDFWWAQPVSNEDRIAGGRCATTGILAPGHAMVVVDGVKHIAEFAPLPDRRRTG